MVIVVMVKMVKEVTAKPEVLTRVMVELIGIMIVGSDRSDNNCHGDNAGDSGCDAWGHGRGVWCWSWWGAVRVS